MRMCIFESDASRLEPLSLTRPVFNLLCGAYSLAQRHLDWCKPRHCGVLVRPELKELVRVQQRQWHFNDPVWIGAGRTVLVNARWLPAHKKVQFPARPCVGICDAEVAFAVIDAKQMRGTTWELFPELLESWQQNLPARSAGGRMIRYPWDLVALNGMQLERDFVNVKKTKIAGKIPKHVVTVGKSANAWIHPDARIEPYVCLDTSAGPIMIDAHAIVRSFSRVEGPCYIGPYTHVQGAKVQGGTTLGPHCRIGGEVEASIIHGHSNKYHDGFLGHSYVGEWVNLGAGTQNSDLRNDYGEVAVTIGGKAVATGQTKVGCFIGDHTKTGLGTLINTGTNIGAFCNLLPAGRLAPKTVPSFCDWWNGTLREGQSLEALLHTARQVMQRRGEELTDAHLELYTRLFHNTATARRRVVAESAQRTLRQSA